ncbi:MAG: VanZ family protein [Pseudohongiella sp.]|nr:VanZ family protein [Pseudohongiella sp.]
MNEKMTPPSPMEKRLALLALVFVLLVLLTPGPVIEAIKNWLSLPVMPPSQSAFPADKVVHCMMFAACGYLSARAWAGRFNLVLLLVGLLGFAALTEVLQTLVPGRSGDIADFLADAVGIFIGLWWFKRRA